MPHMIPQYTHAPMVRVDTNDGDFLVPADAFNPERPLECTEGTDYHGHKEVTGWFCRYSAPGYLDATEWDGPYRTPEEAQDELGSQDELKCPLCGGNVDEQGTCDHFGCQLQPFSRQRLAELSYGYDLDAGGYFFENPAAAELRDIGACVLDSGFDYFSWSDQNVYALNFPVYAFRPITVYSVDLPPPWPESWEDADGDVYTLRDHGCLYESERECLCIGHDEDHPEKPHPDCHRCEGEGTVLSEGGLWALYAMADEDGQEDS